MRSLKNNSAVSEVVGYVLALLLMTVIIAGAYFMTNSTVDTKINTVAKLQARNIADHVSDSIVNALTTHQNHPSVNYTRLIDIPEKIAGKEYYIQTTNRWVYVNSTDGQISEKKSLFNLPKHSYIDVRNKVYGSTGKIEINCPSSDFIYKFDFGPANSTSPWDRIDGYTRISNITKDQLPSSVRTIWSNSYPDHLYCTRIWISNPTDSLIEPEDGYPIMIGLNPSNFDYSLANSDGSDLRFYDSKKDVKLNHWIERWNPYNTSTSRVWVNVSKIDSDGRYIYLFHGDENAVSESNGKNVFPFFEDFNVDDISNSKLTKNWSFEGKCLISEGQLVLENTSLGDAIATVTSTNISDKWIVETKARATGQGYDRDASIFVRNNTSGNWRYIFHNGKWNNPYSESESDYENYTYFNCSISKNFSKVNTPLGQWPEATATNNPAMENSWVRLVFIVNNSDYVGARYNYGDYSYQACAKWNDTNDDFLTYCNDGRFGLINQYGAPTYYDWIFLRPFRANTSVGSDAFPSDQYPTAYPGGICSNEFGWSDSDSLVYGIRNVSNDLNRDFVGNSNIRYFNISSSVIKDSSDYSIVYNIGDKSNDILGMSIETNSVIKNVKNLYAGNYSTGFFTFTTASSNPSIDIKFNPNGNPYWNICSLTIEEGKRKLYLEEVFS